MNILSRAPLPPSVRTRAVTAVLGPTNTGKTHLAIERMLAHSTGAIGLPLRLLAREVYGRIAERVGPGAVALVTGEEKLVPPRPRFWVATVEALPADLDVSFLAIDEIQLAADLERGHVFTDRILSYRGRDETLLLGAATARPLIEKLLPGVNIVTRPRMSTLTYAGQKKLTRLPRRSAAVAFSADEVYAIAELIRRQRGGAAVVMGALSPRTRNAQVELYQSGDVDFLVATDAIGMGLNLDVEHVAFASTRKFDGFQYRPLTAGELGQIAGRAGRYQRDGTFGVTGRAEPFDDETVERLTTHQFEPLTVLQWRNAALDFSSAAALRRSLDRLPPEQGLTRAPPADDSRALDYAMRDRALAGLKDRARVALLWDVCQVPDFRKIAPANHGDLILTLYEHLAVGGRIPEEWFAAQVGHADDTSGDIDALSNRIAHVRTWTYVANRGSWLADPAHWQGVTRDVEDRLSDALHARLIERFVDRRTSVLMRRLRENAMLDAEITPQGDVMVEGQHVGQLLGLSFIADAGGDGVDARAVRAAATKALAGELEARAERIGRAPDPDFVLAADGVIRWLGAPVGRIAAGAEPLSPRVIPLADEGLSTPARERVEHRLSLWLGTQINTLAKPLIDLRDAQDITGVARGIAFRLVEALGTVERSEVADDVKGLGQEERALLRKHGVRFGAHHIYVPALLKPAPATLLARLWALKHGSLDMPGLAELPALSASGRTSITVDKTFARPLYRLVGFRVAGERAVRIDILERLADIIRPLIAWRPVEGAEPPPGAIAQGGGFVVTPQMTSLLGCAGEEFASVLRGLGYRVERRPAPKPAETPAAAAEAEPDAPEQVTEPAATAAEETSAPSSAEPAEPEAAVAAGDGGEIGPVAPEVADTTTPDEPVNATPMDAGESTVTAAAEAAPEPSSAESFEEPVAEAAMPATESAEPASAPTAEPEAVEAAAPEAPAAPQFIEIWRPGRFERKPHGPRRQGGDANAGAGRGRRHGRPPHAAAAAPAEGGGAAPVAEAAAPAAREDHRRNRDEGGERSRDGRRPRRFDGPRDRDRNREDRRGGEGREGGGRPPRTADAGNAGNSRDTSRNPGPRPSRGPDPDSPFAKLAALKAQLEDQTRRK